MEPQAQAYFLDGVRKVAAASTPLHHQPCLGLKPGFMKSSNLYIKPLPWENTSRCPVCGYSVRQRVHLSSLSEEGNGGGSETALR